MDADRFDGLVRTFGQAQSRRQALRGLAAVGAFALGGYQPEQTTAAGVDVEHDATKQCKKKSGNAKKKCLKKAKKHNASHFLSCSSIGESSFCFAGDVCCPGNLCCDAAFPVCCGALCCRTGFVCSGGACV